MSTPNPTALSVALYWSLPGPSRFTSELAHSLDSTAVLVIRIDSSHVTGIRHALREALTSACPAPERVEFVELDEGSHLESDVGHHFGRATVSALELARWSAPPRTTIVLTPRTARARERCRAYLEEYAYELIPGQKCTTRLVLVWHSSDDALTPKVGQRVSFDGALSPDEMHAYVSLRMLGQRGPGTTSLSRHLVTEFAGPDALLAEELMRLRHEELLRLPNSLSLVSSLVGPDAGTATLRDWEVSRSPGPEAKAARNRIDSMYWRACVRSLLPWLEERRRPIIERLRLTLEDYLYPTGGVWKKPNPWQQHKSVDIRIDDLEFNDVVAMSHYPADPLAPVDAEAQRLVTACKFAKRVRDALAHLRSPTVEDIEGMVRTFDEILAD
ncbi:MAG: hypothetical protein KBC94_00780 [Pseudacidovorax sp.]|uniref:hypothetical protein n=1 Tax=Pseudacidovorax sp. TaxID=1934311 RepID=UPI001B5EF147|nr:hypothetical protein [Pseudacidovorax sp.]MBP6892928.1 hypothetical protein [Pseudacidovorax sp.]